VDAINRYDLLVVGGGINGTGLARDIAGRGLSVLLCEQDDLAAHTSSASTKLIHGGLRYLEYGEFSLVRKALMERETLLAAAPHIMRPLRFVMPHVPGLRPSWLIRIGLFLYDHLARRVTLPGSRAIDLRRHPAGAPLDGTLTRGYVYSDGWVDDARLVVLNALDAREHGAKILTRTRLVSATRDAGIWRAQLRQADGSLLEVEARALANAAGPWAGTLLGDALAQPAPPMLRLVKGSHIVVPRLFEHEHAYIFQNPDRRIVFAIPYERDFTLVGTTDVEYVGDPAAVAIDGDEIRYLCDSINRYFKRPIAPAEVRWTYSGVRPLLEDANAPAAAVTRDYHLELDTEGAPLLSVLGGKITTYRKLAEEAAGQLCAALGHDAKDWTAHAPLPGGDTGSDFTGFVTRFCNAHAWLPTALAQRYAHAYGTRASQVIGRASSLDELGDCIAPQLYEAELRYLRDVEWARGADDILWRRSKLGLHLLPEQLAMASAAIDAWFDAEREAHTATRP
jgi:glycerol-3-phosphate dehydrogenase